MGTSVPERDITPTEPEERPEEEAEEGAETEQPTEEAPTKKNWKENFNVKEMTEIETIERLRIIAGVNEYKGNYLVFLAKVTDKDFSRHFFSMPAWVWNKALPVLQKHALGIAEVEKKAMADAVLAELKRLKELGIDVGALVGQV